jgi:hypothetical protein
MEWTTQLVSVEASVVVYNIKEHTLGLLNIPICKCVSIIILLEHNQKPTDA